jgi:hypothetical protein
LHENGGVADSNAGGQFWVGEVVREFELDQRPGPVTVRGCVSMLNGDYVLTKENPGVTYQRYGTHEIKLKAYLGKRVEITGKKSSTLPTSEDAINARMGSASPVSITVESIKTISKQCQSR